MSKLHGAGTRKNVIELAAYLQEPIVISNGYILIRGKNYKGFIRAYEKLQILKRKFLRVIKEEAM